jgi:hypothetical protein
MNRYLAINIGGKITLSSIVIQNRITLTSLYIGGVLARVLASNAIACGRFSTTLHVRAMTGRLDSAQNQDNVSD